MICELLPPDTGRAYLAMRELRPQLVDETAFVRQVDEVQRPAGYRLVAAFEQPDQAAVAVAGFRVGENLAWGRHVYVDDVSTVPAARGRGHARALVDWLCAEAERSGCRAVHLDSGVGPQRWDAHRLYLNAGFVITSHHFARFLDRARSPRS